MILGRTYREVDEMKVANLKVYNRNREPIGDVQITDGQIRSAIALYDREYPLNDYPRTNERPHVTTWLENAIYVYAIRFRGKCYPPKHILWSAIGPGSEERNRFMGGGRRGRANWVLERLDFEVVPKSECGQAAAVQMVDEAELVSLRRQLAEARGNLRLIRERKSQHVMETEIPLQLVKQERQVLERIEELERCLQAMQH